MKKLLFSMLLFIQPLLADVSLDGISIFGWDLFKTSTTRHENTIFSPYSIYSCLTMTALGAQGETLTEMKKVLHLPSDLAILSATLSANNASLGDHLKVANSLWIAPQFAINADFRKKIEDQFHARVASLDFAVPQTAAETINQWIAEKTNQKITQILTEKDLQSSTRLVLVNALYFSGKFLKPFNPKRTSLESFWVEEASKMQTMMMEQNAVLLYTEDDVFQTVALPLEASQIAFVIFLPKKAVFSNLPSLINTEKFQAILENLDLEKVHLKLPKFTLKQRFNLQEPLTKLGMTSAFTPHANFSGIDGKLDLFLSKILHEAYFALDESGIVAAAATASAMSTTAVAPQPSKEFYADHPFIFALVDLQTKIPLFLGEIVQPP